MDFSRDEKLSHEEAKDILLRGVESRPNSGSPGGDDPPNPDPYIQKLPYFLFICAQSYPPGSRRRENEDKQRECEAKNLMKQIYDEKDEVDYNMYNTTKTVDSYDEMLREIEAFVSDKMVIQLPIVVFLGHGTKDGKLCFRKQSIDVRESEGENLMKMISNGMARDKNKTTKTVDSDDKMLQEVKVFASDKESSQHPLVVILGHGSEDGTLCFPKLCFYPDYPPAKYVHCRKALADVRECFKQNRRREMPTCQVRFIFAQCYGHLVDENNMPGVIQESEIEYAYITKITDTPSARSQKSHSGITLEHTRKFKVSWVQSTSICCLDD